MAQNELEQLRATNRVMPVSKEDEGRSWSKISSGVYGFTYSPASEDGGLFLKQPRQSFEMHKLGDGTLLIVAFATADGAERLKSKGAQELAVYPESRGEHTVLVTIPHGRIASAKPPDRLDYNLLKINLRPVE